MLSSDSQSVQFAEAKFREGDQPVFPSERIDSISSIEPFVKRRLKFHRDSHRICISILRIFFIERSSARSRPIDPCAYYRIDRGGNVDPENQFVVFPVLSLRKSIKHAADIGGSVVAPTTARV